MDTPILTLDTNVLVSALRSRRGASFRLVDMVGRGRFEIGVTTTLVTEYEAVCKRLVGVLPVTPEYVDRVVNYFCRVGRHGIVYFRTRPATADPGDDMVLETAVATASDWIVTHNLKDIAAGAVMYGIEAITPAEALARLGEKR